MAIGSYPAALVFLNESMLDTIYVAHILPNDDLLRIQSSSVRAYPEWSLDYKKWMFVRTNPEIVTETMRERAAFAAKKVEAISKIIYSINNLRTKIGTGLWFQENIYVEKARESQLLKDAGFAGIDVNAVPYVAQYADDNGISLQQAAEEILLQAQLDREYLAKTERIRLAVFKKIKLARTAEEIRTIMENFRTS